MSLKSAEVAWNMLCHNSGGEWLKLEEKNYKLISGLHDILLIFQCNIWSNLILITYIFFERIIYFYFDIVSVSTWIFEWHWIWTCFGIRTLWIVWPRLSQLFELVFNIESWVSCLEFENYLWKHILKKIAYYISFALIHTIWLF